MPGAHRHLQFGPATREVSAAVTGGQLVEPDAATGKVRPASADSATVLGVAMADAQPDGTNPTDPLNVAWAQRDVAIGYGPGEYLLTFSGGAADGALVYATANGEVSGTAGTGPAVGRCTEPGGVTAAGTGFVRLFI